MVGFAAAGPRRGVSEREMAILVLTGRTIHDSEQVDCVGLTAPGSWFLGAKIAHVLSGVVFLRKRWATDAQTTTGGCKGWPDGWQRFKHNGLSAFL